MLRVRDGGRFRLFSLQVSIHFTTSTHSIHFYQSSRITVDALGRRCSVRRPDVVAQTRDGGTPSLAGDALNILYTAPRGDWSEREGRSETTDCLSDSTLYSLDTCDMRHFTFDLTFDSLQGGGAAAGGIGVFFNTRKGQFQYKKGSISIHDNTAAGRK